MPATVTIQRRIGSSGSPTDTDITSATTRLSLSDSSTPGILNPLIIPSSGINYSFWAVFFLNANTTPAGTIDTVKLYSDGSNTYGTGVAVKVGQATGYTQATGSSTSGTQLTTSNYATLTGDPVDIFSYTSGSPLAVTGTLSNPSTGIISNFIPLQMEIISTATPGVLTAETFTITYNET